MNFLSVGLHYLSWHYTKGVKEYFIIWRDFLVFLWKFFSISELLRTFFMPFERLQEKYAGGLDIENFLATLTVTTLMRLVGMFMRSVVIVLGLAILSIFSVGGIVAFIFWLTLPAVSLATVVLSIIKLIP